jgi:hypothetical protein
MRSIGFCVLYLNITITILEIIRLPVFYLYHVSETGFYLRLQVEPIFVPRQTE